MVLPVGVGLFKKKDAKIRRACGWMWTRWWGEKKCSDLLLPIVIDLALRSNMRRRVDVLWMRQAPVLLRIATAPKTLMRDAEVEDQAPAVRLVS